VQWSLHSAKLGNFAPAACISHLCQVQWPLHLAKVVILPSVLTPSARQKKNSKNIKDTLPSVGPAALCKEFTKKRLCRVPILGHSANLHQASGAMTALLPSAREKTLGKEPLPINFSPSALCRVPHSAKALPSAKGPLPSVPGTRQRGRIQ
jgi:hypothetical protein